MIRKSGYLKEEKARIQKDTATKSRAGANKAARIWLELQHLFLINLTEA